MPTQRSALQNHPSRLHAKQPNHVARARARGVSVQPNHDSTKTAENVARARARGVSVQPNHDSTENTVSGARMAPSYV